MAWHRAIVAAAVLSTTALACEVILGIKDDGFRVADAATIADPCVHAFPPPPPDASDNGTTLPDLVFAIGETRLSGRDEAGAPVGYDLDGVCTCDPRPGSAHGGAPSCTPPDPDASTCDGEGGIDDVSAVDFPAALAAAADSNYQSQYLCGRQTMLIQLSHYNGLADDPEVFVAVAPSYGIIDPHDGGEDLDAAARCAFPGQVVGLDAGWYPAKDDGTDLWSVTAASVDQGVLRDRFQGYVTNGQLVVRLETPTDQGGGWSLVVAGRVVPYQTTILTAKLTLQPDKTYRLEDGIMTGRVAVDDMLSSIGALRIETASYVCAQDFYPAVKALLCRSPDVARLPTDDFKGTTCDALSVAFQFNASPAAIGGIQAPQSEIPTGCGTGFIDNCAK